MLRKLSERHPIQYGHARRRGVEIKANPRVGSPLSRLRALGESVDADQVIDDLKAIHKKNCERRGRDS